jgi:nitronate monooxygenase
MTKIETALTRLLGITHPILLAPMGSAAGGRLAAAVTHAGGLGLIGSGYAEAGAITRELVAAGNARVGVGFITWVLDAKPEVLRVALAARPAAIMLSFGDPMPYLAAIRDAGSRIICQVQTLAEAEQATRLGVDVIVAQGRDAGGHSGTTAERWDLAPAVVDLAGRSRWSRPAALPMAAAWRRRSASARRAH